jgi:hypothetical protein
MNEEIGPELAKLSSYGGCDLMLLRTGIRARFFGIGANLYSKE